MCVSSVASGSDMSIEVLKEPAIVTSRASAGDLTCQLPSGGKREFQDVMRLLPLQDDLRQAVVLAVTSCRYSCRWNVCVFVKKPSKLNGLPIELC